VAPASDGSIVARRETEYRALLRETERSPSPHFPSGLYAALRFADDLPHEKVVALLDTQIAGLERQLADWSAGELEKGPCAGTLPGYVGAIFENGRKHMQTDLRFLRYLRETLPTETGLSTPIPPVPDPETS
jgi:hypothetical protein